MIDLNFKATHRVSETCTSWRGEDCVKALSYNDENHCYTVQDSTGDTGVVHLVYMYPLPPSPPEAQQFTAPKMLQKASELMVERAVQYDSPEGERSMEKIVNSFNAITGHELTEAEGWMFMILLKLVRDNTRAIGHQDSCEDLIAYSSLYGESRLAK